MTTKTRVTIPVLAAALLLTGGLFAQTSSGQAANGQAANSKQVEQDIELMRKDVRSQKKQIIAANLQLTDKESEKFWPLYDQYTAELVKINDTKYAAIKDYAANIDNLSDEKAVSLTRQALDVDASVAQLRLKYVPIFNKVISGKKTGLFFQLDRRLVMLIDLQLAEQIPLVQP